MSFNYSKGAQVIGDLKAADDQQRDTKIDFEEDYIGFETAGSTRMVISGSQGKVGIGTDNPSHKLDINGDIRVRGNDIRDNSGNPAISFDGNGNVGTLQITGSVTPDEALEEQTISLYLDEGNNQLKVKVKYSDGLIKTGTISLS